MVSAESIKAILEAGPLSKDDADKFVILLDKFIEERVRFHKEKLEQQHNIAAEPKVEYRRTENK